MSTTLYIGDDFSITENGKFTIESRVHLNEMGFPDTVETFIEVEGDVVQGGSIDGQTIATTPTGVYNAIELIKSQLDQQSPKHFYVDVDGTTEFDFEPNTCVNSPLITNFRTISDTGAADSHWKYGLTVYIRQGARSDVPQGVLEFASSIVTTFIEDAQGKRPIRKHWAATCKARNVTIAEAFIRTLAPSASALSTTYGRFFQEGRATGDWVWEYSQEQKIVENIEVTGRGASYAASTQVGPDGAEVMPLFHRTPRAPIVIILEGEISSNDIEKVIQPDLHWEEGDDLFHDVGNERSSERVIYDDMRGIYKLRYQERWVGRKYVQPNHHDHSLIRVVNEPGDGPIAGINR